MKLARVLFDELRRMDAEAADLADGTPTGLRGYYAFKFGRYRTGRGSAWENTWTEREGTLVREASRFQAKPACVRAHFDR